ncbi:hypothetical protein GJ697_29065 [Pseudoduganella sp. FT25W]|uniref:DUF883 domain-containing protein n=1 Tax=Duganella alba TaxID=2666081 RepID=A0A6L5QRB3_9BURK|nr:DUF883 family protein [Duganella alba]MRX11888.1 hypothetical protein [Duganella alba]MRX20276.1 hypothetical protein [Duganella alba]
MDGQPPNSPTQESLLDDLRQVIENAEELLKNTDQYHGALYQAARNKLAEALQTATSELARFEDVQIDRMIELTAIAARLHRDLTGEARLLRAFRRED